MKGKVFYRPKERDGNKEKVQCLDGCRVWEGTVLSIIADCTGLILYRIKFDEAVDASVSND